MGSLALEVARVGLGEELEVEFNQNHLVKGIRFVKSDRRIDVTPLGSSED